MRQDSASMGKPDVAPKTAAGSKDAVARSTLQQSVLRKFRTIFSSAKKHFRAIEAAAGISGAQLWALIEVRDHPGLTVSDIARRLSVHLSTASNLLDKLESRSLVKRTRNVRDQRIVQIHLTTRGRRMLSNAPGPARGVVPDALARLPTQQLQSLERDLEALVACMSRRDRRGSVTPLSEL